MPLRTHRIAVNGIGTPVREAGPEQATEAVVFVHGNPGSSQDWEELLEATGRFARAVAFDMPGFGGADKPRDFKYQVASYAEFIEEALGVLGVERAHLVLHDFGGPFGLLWGLQNPERWGSVVLINIGILPGYKWHVLARRWRTPVVGELMQLWIPRAGWRRAMQASNPKGLPTAFVDRMYDDYDRGTRRAVLELYRSTPDPGDQAATVGAAIGALRKPALVVWGAKDPYISVRYAERQREFFDVESVILLPESGHWPFQDDPQGVEQAVLPFLRSRLGAPSVS